MSKTHINSYGNKGMEYGSPNTPDAIKSYLLETFELDRPFVLTQDKKLITGLPYMLMEGNRTKAVRLLKIWQEDNIINLDVQELQSPKSFTLSWNLDYEGDYYLWTIADLSTLFNQRDELTCNLFKYISFR